jgi:nucleotide-binding universal stress UspA family protein
MPDRRRPHAAVVVGIDDTESAELALLWAAHEAEFRGCPLVVAHGYRHLGWRAGPEVDRANRRRALRLIGTAVAAAVAAEPGLVVVPHVAPGSARAAMYGAVGQPELFVVGHRPRAPPRCRRHHGARWPTSSPSADPITTLRNVLC